MGRLDGKVVLITGGARGQGRSHAVTYAREGADIVLSDICAPLPGVVYPAATPADLAETVRLVEKLDRRCLASAADAPTARRWEPSSSRPSRSSAVSTCCMSTTE